MRELTNAYPYRLALAAFILLAASHAYAAPDVFTAPGDVAGLKFSGVVTKVSNGRVTAEVFVQVVSETGDDCFDVGVIQFQPSSGPMPQVDDLIDGGRVAGGRLGDTARMTVIAEVVYGQWRTAKTSGGMQRGSLLGVSTGSTATPDD